MKSTIRLGIFAVVLMVVVQSFLGGSALPPPFTTRPTLASALDASKADGKTVIVFYTADWCNPCSRFKSGALRHAEVTQAFENFHAALIDCSDGAPADDRFAVETYPTLIAIRHGVEVDRLSGNQSAQQLLGWFAELNARDQSRLE